MQVAIIDRFTEEVILSGEYESKKDCLEKNREADLAGVDLAGANLYGVDLAGANLYGADLAGADLAGADLAGADLAGANLAGADLAGANLAGANLYGANLYRADLTRASLTGADLDMSCWPLWCGSLNVKTDRRLRVQLMFHTLSLMCHCDDLGDDEKEIYSFFLKYANEFHHTDVSWLGVKLEVNKKEDFYEKK